ncbi:beta-ketoacyl synthase N-terminal-like domain-containing protein [Streptantibioticus silvisoli]|uniref:Beta-ketoacyl synthase N-terminal-like domain-containing protein n=1 Tax=Streptantibioticus silvisoli TaxID=2705255 RepID=A0ABT6VVD8_9ACTN|nr:beta-ketoacyl synthase N-terminal-like domain-containing protein [Streptantibioticus silvisoli]MDI5962442.1 beta-ketoacyl synthase N-terminal-like domain-containing protein [Streptantibioticus silvisoli]
MGIAVPDQVRGPVITGWSAVSPYGIGRDAFVQGVSSGRATVSVLDTDKWPGPDELACLVPDFDVREVLGKKGTRSMDRVTGLAVTAVRELLRDETRQRDPFADEEVAALVLGTTTGSAQSMMDLTRDTWINEAPFHVDPGRFPNTVMNCAAGQCAIWYGLKGPNTTVAGGRASGLLALNYARRLLTAGRAHTILCGAAEEYSPARSWLERHTRHPDENATVLGEGCAVLRLQPPGTHPHPLAELLCITTAITHPHHITTTLAHTIKRALHQTRLNPHDIWAVSPSTPPGTTADHERNALDLIFTDHTPHHIPAPGPIGDTAAATATFQITTLLSHHQQHPQPPNRIALITAIDRDGVLATALLRLL